MFRNDHDTYDRYSSYDSYGQEARIAGKQRYFAQTYGLMAGALAVTFLVALATARFFPQVAASSGIVIFLCIAQLVLVFSLSRSLTRGNTTSTLVKFLLYAAFTGVSFSSIFLYFRAETLVLCFLATAASFGGMALYGLYSKRDILSWGRHLVRRPDRPAGAHAAGVLPVGTHLPSVHQCFGRTGLYGHDRLRHSEAESDV